MSDVVRARKKVVLISRYSSQRGGPAYDGIFIVLDRLIFTAGNKMTDIDLLRFVLLQIANPTEIRFTISNVLFLIDALILCRAHMHKVRFNFNDKT